MSTDYSYYNQAFVDDLNAFLDYTIPNTFPDREKGGLVVRRCLTREDYEKRCIQRWAISELVDLIANNPYDQFEDTAYKFALKLLSFEIIAIDEDVKRCFHIASDFIDKEVIGRIRANEGIYP